MAITLVFNVPVHVEVDEVDRAVLSVKVDDERAEGPVEFLGGPEGKDSAQVLASATAIADEVSWPAWEFGL